MSRGSAAALAGAPATSSTSRGENITDGQRAERVAQPVGHDAVEPHALASRLRARSRRRSRARRRVVDFGADVRSRRRRSARGPVARAAHRPQQAAGSRSASSRFVLPWPLSPTSDEAFAGDVELARARGCGSPERQRRDAPARRPTRSRARCRLRRRVNVAAARFSRNARVPSRMSSRAGEQAERRRPRASSASSSGSRCPRSTASMQRASASGAFASICLQHRVARPPSARRPERRDSPGRCEALRRVDRSRR